MCNLGYFINIVINSVNLQRQEAGTQATEVEQTLQANHACQWQNSHRTADKKQVSAECEW